jgi:hypothetical protein
MFSHKPSSNRETFMTTTHGINPTDSMEPRDGEQDEESRLGGNTMGDREIQSSVLTGQ